MNIVFLDAKTLGDIQNLDVLKRFGNLKVFTNTKPDERLTHIQDAEIIITNKVLINKEIMDLCPNLKLICVSATGLNNIDLVHAKNKGIEVKNVENYSTESVAQHTVSMILHLVNRLQYFDSYVKSGLYVQSDMFTHFGPPIYELKGKRLGIAGLGNIGKRVARIMEKFGMEVVYYSTSGKNNNNDYLRVEFDELVVTSDIICIHAPLNEHTHNLFTLSTFKLMKPASFIINAGRGGIINEVDLAEAINNDLIAGAGLDVFEREPMASDSALLSVKYPERIVLTPHIAWTSFEARSLLIEKIADNSASFLNKK